MKRKTYVMIAMMAAATWSGPLHAAPPANEPGGPADAPVREAEPPKEGEVSMDVRNLSPMHREIFDAVEEERARVEDLNERFLRAALAQEKLAIQQEIEAVKRDGMIAVLEIQLRYATAEGRAEMAAQLETAIEAMKNPKLSEVSAPTMLERAGSAGGK